MKNIIYIYIVFYVKSKFKKLMLFFREFEFNFRNNNEEK